MLILLQGIPDNTIEDLYIDDELDNALNPNIALHDGLLLDKDFLSEMSEL